MSEPSEHIFCNLSICRRCTHITSHSPGGYQHRKYEHKCSISYDRETIAIEYFDGTIRDSLLFIPEKCPYRLEHILEEERTLENRLEDFYKDNSDFYKDKS